MARFAAGARASCGRYVAIGSSTPLIIPRPMAMPTSTEMMLFDADLMLAKRFAVIFAA